MTLPTLTAIAAKPNEQAKAAFATLISIAAKQEDNSRTNYHRSIVKYMRDLDKAGGQPDVPSYTKILSGYGVRSEAEFVVKNMLEAQQSEQLSEQQLYRVIIDFIAMVRLRSVQLSVNKSAWRSSQNFSVAVAGSTKSYSDRLLQELFMSRRIHPDCATYNILLASFAEGRAFKAGENRDFAEDWLHKMENDRIAPSLVTFHTLISIATKQEDNSAVNFHKSVMKYMKKMAKLQIEPTSATYSKILNGYGIRGDSALAVGAFRAMQRCGIAPLPSSFTNVMKGFVRNNELTEARAWLDEMRQTLGTADVVAYGCLIDGYSQRGDVSSCLKLFKEMIG